MIKLYNNNEVIAYIDNNLGNYNLVRTDSKLEVPMGLFPNNSKTTTFERFQNWLLDRAFPEERIGSEELLEKMGLKKYNPIEIVKITNARQFADSFWVEWC